MLTSVSSKYSYLAGILVCCRARPSSRPWREAVKGGGEELTSRYALGREG